MVMDRSTRILVALTVTSFLVVVVILIDSGSSSSSRFHGCPSPSPNRIHHDQIQLNNNNTITRGSSISTLANDINFWLSPSGNIAFGFYPLCNVGGGGDCTNNDGHVVGIWFVNCPRKTLVWSYNHNTPPLIGLSSIHFNNDGKFILQTPDGEDHHLFGALLEPASHAELLDNGNFVVYGSESVTLWQSFDHPTDTLLSGQSLKPGQSLVSISTSKDKYRIKFPDEYGYPSHTYKATINHRLTMESDGTIRFYIVYILFDRYVKGSSIGRPQHRQPSSGTSATLQMDSKGGLYLVSDQDSKILTTVTNGCHREQQPQPQGPQPQPQPQQQLINEHGEDGVLYRATLSGDGNLQLFKDRIGSQVGGNESLSFLAWDLFGTRKEQDQVHYISSLKQCAILLSIGIGIVIVVKFIIYIRKKSCTGNKDGGGGASISPLEELSTHDGNEQAGAAHAQP